TDEEGNKAALNFLHSGDHLLLSEANCSKRFQLIDLQAPPPETILTHLRGPQDSLLHATNFLNMIFQASDMRESSIKEDMEWYHALVRSLAGGNPHIRRALLYFTAHPMSSKPLLLLQATKKGHEILLQDLSSEFYHGRQKENWRPWGIFHNSPSLTKSVLLNDLRSLETPKWSRGDSYIVDSSHVQWSKPFLECEGGHFTQGWMISMSTSFYGLKPDLSPEFKGTLLVDVQLQNLGIDQCSPGPGWFANSHSCDENSTQCISDEKDGSVLGRYRCVCQPGYYRTRHEGSSFSNFACQPCSEGCATCVDGSPCLVQEDWALRVTVLSLQATGMLLVFLSMLVSYNFKDSKRIRASGLVLLETILFGSLLLYFPVFILYFKPSAFRCLVLRWVRLLGFCIVYGTMILKLYRVMKVFLSRTAQRVPYMTSMRLLRMLLVIMLFCVWFLVGWTLGVLENLQRGVPLVIRTQTRDGLVFYTCAHDRWDYMMSIAEMLLLFWGSFLCYGARTVPSAFHEPRYMGIAIHNEMLVSAAFHVIRFLIVPSLHPDWTLLLFFIHTHGTVTMTLTLLFVPKFLHAGAPPREEIAEVYEDELDLRRSRSNLNSSITSAWSEHSLDPDDIRDELKKLYAQLEVHKTKKMTVNNPHLQKKRSSRRGLGRSIMRRITEIPDSVTKQSGREEREGSPGSSGGQKRKQQDSGSVKLREESLRQRVLSLRKSHSTYDHMQEAKDAGSASPRLECSSRDASLRDSLMRRNLARNVSLRSRGDSLNQAPLVCKSLSAHNLLADKKPLCVHAAPLQKSHSMMGSAKGKGPLIASGEIPTERAIEGSRNPLLGGSFDKAEVCPWEVQDLPPPTESRSQKHVTYAPGKCSSLDSSHTTEKAHISRGKKGDIGVKHHSMGSGEGTKSPGQLRHTHSQGSTKHDTDKSDLVTVKPGTVQGCMFDLDGLNKPGQIVEGTNLTGKDTEPTDSLRRHHRGKFKGLVLAVRAFKSTAAAREHKETEKEPVDTAKSPIKNSIEDICPWETESTSFIVKEESTDLPFAETEQICSSPKKEGSAIPEINMNKEDPTSPKQITKEATSVSKLERMSKLREAVCPWESLEGPQNIPHKSQSIESKRSEICPWESTDIEDPRGLLSKSGSNVSLQSPCNKIRKVHSVCDNMERSQRADICPWEMVEGGDTKEKGSSWKENSALSLKEQICPWETTKEENQRSDICPWETSNMENVAVGGVGKKSLTIKLEELGRQRDAVCPWESEESVGSPGALSQSPTKTFKARSVQSKTSDSLNLEARREEICPWESLDSDGTPALMSQSQSQHWEQPRKEVGEICPEVPTQTNTDSQGTVCKSQSKQGSLCSLSSEDPQPMSKILSKSESRIGDLYTKITPVQYTRHGHHSLREQSFSHNRDTEFTVSSEQKEMESSTRRTRSEDPCKLAEICPWEVQESPTEEQPMNKKEDICPWDFQ
ncbi:hypothetical protein GDO86_014368, partial [Hymenochirus boettgeri]